MQLTTTDIGLLDPWKLVHSPLLSEVHLSIFKDTRDQWFLNIWFCEAQMNTHLKLPQKMSPKRTLGMAVLNNLLPGDIHKIIHLK
jgi:hypothetical protein